MSLIVQKYGGTSVGTPERIVEVARRILRTHQEGSQVVAVLSAMSGVTDNLIKLARQVAPHPAEREMDVLLATGEQIRSHSRRWRSTAWGGELFR
jgi:aspartate kinase